MSVPRVEISEEPSQEPPESMICVPCMGGTHSMCLTPTEKCQEQEFQDTNQGVEAVLSDLLSQSLSACKIHDCFPCGQGTAFRSYSRKLSGGVNGQQERLSWR